MFVGEVTWLGGPVALFTLKRYLANGPDDGALPVMPAGVAEVLGKCFRDNPEERWTNLAEAADVLRRVYRDVTGRDHPRPVPASSSRGSAAAVLHDRRTTTGVEWDDPRKWLVKALQAEGGDPAEADAFLAPRWGTRQAQAVADLAAYDEARRRYERLVAGGRKDLETELAVLCVKKAFVHKYAEDIPGALALYDRAITIRERLVEQEGRRELANELAAAYTNKAVAVRALGDNRAAVELYDRAIAVYERLVEREGRRELANDLARTYTNKANAVYSLGDNRAAVALYDRAIAIRERLVEQEGRRELQGDLARAIAWRAEDLFKLGDRPRAQTDARKAVAMLRAEVARTGRADLQRILDWANKALKDVL
jgi:tetratricopeptide (TPR) repeat protein